jgi:hypothetical protein
MCWLYRRVQEPGAASVGFEIGFFVPIVQTPAGNWVSQWECVRVYPREEAAAVAVNYLNGGSSPPALQPVVR